MDGSNNANFDKWAVGRVLVSSISDYASVFRELIELAKPLPMRFSGIGSLSSERNYIIYEAENTQFITTDASLYEQHLFRLQHELMDKLVDAKVSAAIAKNDTGDNTGNGTDIGKDNISDSEIEQIKAKFTKVQSKISTLRENAWSFGHETASYGVIINHMFYGTLNGVDVVERNMLTSQTTPFTADTLNTVLMELPIPILQSFAATHLSRCAIVATNPDPRLTTTIAAANGSRITVLAANIGKTCDAQFHNHDLITLNFAVSQIALNAFAHCIHTCEFPKQYEMTTLDIVQLLMLIDHFGLELVTA
jgi:hypothetical protein